jgi:hypothetical protein
MIFRVFCFRPGAGYQVPSHLIHLKTRTMFHAVNQPPTTSKVLIPMLILMVVFISSCKKGDTGPQGSPGTANVIYSDWFIPSAWTMSTIFGIKNFDYTRQAPAITQAIIDSGMVLTFGKLSGYNTQVWPAGQIAQLPVSLTYVQGNTTTDTWSAFDSVGKLRINFVNNLNIYSSINTQHSFRYIIVPGGVKASSGGRRADFRTMSYNEVCNFLKVPG